MKNTEMSEDQIKAVSENLKLRAEMASIRARLLENNAELILNAGSNSSKYIDVMCL